MKILWELVLKFKVCKCENVLATFECDFGWYLLVVYKYVCEICCGILDYRIDI